MIKFHKHYLTETSQKLTFTLTFKVAMGHHPTLLESVNTRNYNKKLLKICKSCNDVG